MTTQMELFPKPPETDEIIAGVKSHIRSAFAEQRQPTPEELLRELTQKLGWYARHLLVRAVTELRNEPKIASYLRDYLKSTLSDENLAAALRDGTKPSPQETSTLDELFRKSIIYRNSAKFREALEFSAKFRDYAPYNNLLVKVQNPSCSYYATARDWEDRFKRQVKEDARPMLILAPMHPVMLVYDLDQTEGPDLPDHIKNFAQADGEFDPDRLHKTLENAKRMCILVQHKELSTTHGAL